jgi:hypothetical protein
MRLLHLPAALLLTLTPASLSGQFAENQQGGGPGWAPVSIGVHGGYDNTQHGWMLGGFLGLPVLPSGAVELMPSADVTYLPGFEEYQANFEAVYVTGARRGGVIAGGGVGLRNSVFGPDPNADRRTVVTFSLVVGARLGTVGRFRPQVETRWILQSEQSRDPRQVLFGVGFALWGR